MFKNTYIEEIDFNDLSISIDFDQLVELSHKIIDSDFYCYFKEGTKYLCSAIHEKGEILYDLLYSNSYFSSDNKFVLLTSNINNYGTYAIDNLLFKEEWEKDVEKIEY